MNEIDIINQFRNAMAETGIKTSADIKPDGGMNRFTPEGDKKGSLNGWCVLFTDGIPSGAYGNWKDGITHTWCSKLQSELSQTERDEMQRRVAIASELRKEEEAKKHALAAEHASIIWDAAEPCVTHPYLDRKKIISHGLRFGKFPVGETMHENTLLVPIYDGKKIVSLQGISPSYFFADKSKMMLKGGKKSGCYFVIGDTKYAKIIGVAEGYATAASIHAATGYPVYVCFDSGNIANVTEIAKSKHKNSRIVIFADDDRFNEVNTGIEKAKSASDKYHVSYVAPVFFDDDDKPTDFNDLHIKEGLHEVKTQIENALSYGTTVTIPTPLDLAFHEHTMQVTYQPLAVSNDKGVPYSCIENLREICGRLGVLIRYNVITKQEEILIPQKAFTRDNQMNAAYAYLVSWVNKFRMPIGQLGEFVTYISEENLYNPVAEWITSKPWDGQTRIADLFNTVEIEQKDDTHQQMKEVLMYRWFLSAVAAIFEPHGVSAHGVLVFQGEQYLGKTAWFKKLAPKILNVIKDGMILRPDDKDNLSLILSNWMVELGELDSTFRKSDIAQLKAFITKDTDAFRRPFARKESTFARRTVFFASVNPEHYLNDPTGNRRFWTLSVSKLNYSHDIDMQQLWAEFYEIYKTGEKWILNNDEVKMLNSMNEKYETIDPIKERLQSRLSWDSDPKLWKWKIATEILTMCGIDKPTHAEATKCSEVIKALNGKQVKRTGLGRLLLCPPKIDFL